MEFFIRQGASDPILKMKLIDDGKNDKSGFNDLLESCDITFDMYDAKTGEPEILNSDCLIFVNNEVEQKFKEYEKKYVPNRINVI